MYYLFICNEKDLQKYKAEFEQVQKVIEAGKTPVYNELRNANMESLEYQSI